ncbi:hypothetical protein ES703_33213 [subsurface metagenome]
MRLSHQGLAHALYSLHYLFLPGGNVGGKGYYYFISRNPGRMC